MGFCPKIFRTSVPAPRSLRRIDKSHSTEGACRVPLKVVHHALRRVRIGNNDVDMIRAHVHSIKAVSAPFAYLADRMQYDLSFPGAEFEWIVFKLMSTALQFIRTARNGFASMSIEIPPIDRSTFVAMQPGAVTSKRDQESQGDSAILEFDVVAFHRNSVYRVSSPHVSKGSRYRWNRPIRATDETKSLVQRT